jgi:arylsulfatase A-like enzyme/Tfp pilus assembly protein PilF
LITIDTLRADRVGCFGAKPSSTPTLDALCRDGIRFPQAISASSITNTSHASILTGQYPSRHGVSDFAVPVPATSPTIAELLKKQGYRTAAFIGAAILDSSSLAPGFDRGFDHYDNFEQKRDKKQHWDVVERRAGTVVDRTVKWLTASAKGPRFVWMHLYDPHDPYEPPPSFAARYKGNEYEGEIAYADSQIARVITLLKTQRRYDNTLIIAMADHGEGLGEHGEDTHGIFLYDSTVHIPLIVKLPTGTQKGTTHAEQVSSVDVLPTVLEVAHVPDPSNIDGHSMLKPRPDAVVMSETDYPLRFGWAPLRAARTTANKFIEAPRPEFYRLESDPKEQTNDYQPWHSEVQSLRAKVAALREHARTTSSAVPESTVDELRALGYLGTVVGATTAADLSNLPDPKDKIAVQNHLHHGMMSAERGALDAALTSFAKAKQIDPHSVVVLRQAGLAEFEAGRIDAAVTDLEQAHKLASDDANVSLAYGRALLQKGDAAKAKELLAQALKQLPSSYEARVSMGIALAMTGNSGGAKDQLQAAVLLDAKRTQAHLELAKIAIAAGDKTSARDRLQVVLRNEPENNEAKQLLQKLIPSAKRQ